MTFTQLNGPKRERERERERRKKNTHFRVASWATEGQFSTGIRSSASNKETSLTTYNSRLNTFPCLRRAMDVNLAAKWQMPSTRAACFGLIGPCTMLSFFLSFLIPLYSTRPTPDRPAYVTGNVRISIQSEESCFDYCLSHATSRAFHVHYTYSVYPSQSQTCTDKPPCEAIDSSDNCSNSSGGDNDNGITGNIFTGFSV